MAKSKSPLERRTRTVTIWEFKKLLRGGYIRPATLDDVHGTHHGRPLYRHPSTGQWFVAIRKDA